MNKELIFKFLTLDAIKVALKKYRVHVGKIELLDHLEYSMEFMPRDDSEFGFIINVCDKHNGMYTMNSFYGESREYGADVIITKSEFDKFVLNYLTIKDYLKDCTDRTIENLVKEIINE